MHPIEIRLQKVQRHIRIYRMMFIAMLLVITGIIVFSSIQNEKASKRMFGNGTVAVNNR
jgi:D-alanyl-lipoteichoic acid acyltransferase DltB (MBOAT superfamily)